MLTSASVEHAAEDDRGAARRTWCSCSRPPSPTRCCRPSGRARSTSSSRSSPSTRSPVTARVGARRRGRRRSSRTRSRSSPAPPAGSARDAESLLDQALAHRRPGRPSPRSRPLLGGTRSSCAWRSSTRSPPRTSPACSSALAALLDAGHDPRRIAEDLLGIAARRVPPRRARGAGSRVDEPDDVQARLRAVGDALGHGRARARDGDARPGGGRHARHRGRRPAPRARDRARAARPARVERRDRRCSPTASTGSSARLAGGAARAGAAPAAPPRSPHRAPAPAPRRSAPSAPGPGAAAGRARAEPPPRPRAPTGRQAARARRAAQGRRARATPTAAARAAKPATPARAAAAPPTDVAFDLDDAIVAWAEVLDALPPVAAGRRSRRRSRSAVDGNVIVFGVARSHIDTVKPKFQRKPTRSARRSSSGSAAPPKFAFTPHEWGEGEGPPAPASQVRRRDPGAARAAAIDEEPDRPRRRSPSSRTRRQSAGRGGRFGVPTDRHLRCHGRRRTAEVLGAPVAKSKPAAEQHDAAGPADAGGDVRGAGRARRDHGRGQRRRRHGQGDGHRHRRARVGHDLARRRRPRRHRDARGPRRRRGRRREPRRAGAAVRAAWAASPAGSTSAPSASAERRLRAWRRSTKVRSSD